ncbi:spore cortex-lytic enzyme [Devosia sp. LC5]|uniref:peptidoglycan-binding domain-containing protein n=1 Tax=Devosia sp. LC5 TaxID=1502724 RepID=UPI0004E36BAE|nr:peptidoglycan-binding protein [Devosia sp. LC5]KFC71400.1 spore cortex-lytic enzyme [Devosia sp. LC5]
MTATTLSRLPLLAGSAVATYLGRAGLWTFSRYMRAPLASTGLLAMVTMTALAASNALYFQTARHPAPLFTPSLGVAEIVPTPVDAPADAPTIAPTPMQQSVVATPVTNETTGSVTPVTQPIPDAPVGNKEAFQVQKKLTELGLFDGVVDGYYGPRTAQAIRAFEERNGMVPTGAMSREVVDAILRADAAGMVPVQRQAVTAPAPQPVMPPAPVQQVAVQQAPVPVQPVAPPDRVVAQLPPLSPIDDAVDTVGNAAAQTIDSIVAAVDGRPAGASGQPIPALPMMPVSQPMPAPVQVASLEPMAAPRPVTAVVQPQAAPAQATAPLQPANDTQLISQIQRGLASLGFYHAPIDGKPGESTAKAIREFENFHSYRVTGQVNPDLVGLLRDAGATI